MMGYMFPITANSEDVERYMRALIRAQADIDATPEKFKHYFLNELPDRFLKAVDVRQFGAGERVVPQPYTEAMFEQTQKWMHERDLFDVGAQAGVSYETAVYR
jgi:NitT/TauT family transport system substrate-binding protein